jgi:predicted amidohydrolase
MQDLVVAGVQAQQFWEDKVKNLRHFDELLCANDLADVDVLVFPEMFHTGFTMNADGLSEYMEDSMGIEWLKNTSSRYQCLAIASLIISENKQFYNRMVAVYPDGKLAYYDKRHLFSLAAEDQVFTSGTKDCIIDYHGWKIKLQVCFDLRFPEGARNGIGADGQPLYDLLIYNANWPTKRIAHWDILIPARAVENQSYVLAVNRVGTDGNAIEYNGHSQLVDGWGNFLVERQNNSEVLFKATLKMSDLIDLREKLVFLKDKKSTFC